MLHEVKFLSFNERDNVYGWIYVPAAKVKGVVQLVHGFGEHSRRYFHMIVKLMEAGYAVAANDHVGHGKTALENDSWGDWGTKGCRTMMEDERTFQQLVREKYPDVPYFMYGHSMGSIIARQFLAKYGDSLAGAIICGTVGPDAIPCEKGISLLKPMIEAGKGAEADPALLGDLLGGLFSRIEEEVKIGNEWICHDPYVQLDHANDPFDAFTKPTSNEALLQFLEMIAEVNTKEWAESVPKLPLYNVAGGEDPCGSFGEGVRLVSQWLEESGHSVETKIYEGYRHEIHNYKDLKNEMVDGLIAFLDGIAKA